MSTTTPVQTVTVPHEALLDAVAALMAAYEVLISLNGAVGAGTFAEVFSDRAWALRDAAFSDVLALAEKEDLPNEEYDTHPVVVETNARSYELAARSLYDLHGPSQLERALSDERHYELTMRAGKLRKRAKEIRAHGTINVLFPSE